MSLIKSNLETNNFERVKTTLLDFIGTNELVPLLKQVSFQWLGIEPVGYATKNNLGELKTHMFVKMTPSPKVENEGLIFKQPLPYENASFDDANTRELLKVLNKAIKYHHITLAFSGRPKSFPSMTKRERQIVDQLLLGKTNGEIGEKLEISPRTAEKHCQNIFQKFGIKNRYALVSAYNDQLKEHSE